METWELVFDSWCKRITGTLICSKFREGQKEFNHQRDMQTRSRIQTTGQNNGNQLWNNPKSSNGPESPDLSR